MCRSIFKYIHWEWALQLCILIICIVLGISAAKRHSLEARTTLMQKYKYLKCSQELFWFSTVVIVGSPSRSMISLTCVFNIRHGFLLELSVSPFRELLVTTKICVLLLLHPQGYRATPILGAGHRHLSWFRTVVCFYPLKACMLLLIL